jgi:hypothetical protein
VRQKVSRPVSKRGLHRRPRRSKRDDQARGKARRDGRRDAVDGSMKQRGRQCASTASTASTTASSARNYIYRISRDMDTVPDRRGMEGRSYLRTRCVLMSQREEKRSSAGVDLFVLAALGASAFCRRAINGMMADGDNPIN